MAITWSTSLRNGILDAYETLLGTSAKVRIYDGNVPNSVASALGGNNVLVEFALGSDWMDAASGGVKVFSDTPVSATAVGNGTATFYRVLKSDGATAMEQGTVGVSGTDMTIDNTSIAADQIVRITSWSKTAPHA